MVSLFFHNYFFFFTWLTELITFLFCQPFVQDMAKDCGKEEDWATDGRELRCDQGVGHQSHTSAGHTAITYRKERFT